MMVIFNLCISTFYLEDPLSLLEIELILSSDSLVLTYLLFVIAQFCILWRIRLIVPAYNNIKIIDNILALARK